MWQELKEQLDRVVLQKNVEIVRLQSHLGKMEKALLKKSNPGIEPIAQKPSSEPMQPQKDGKLTQSKSPPIVIVFLEELLFV